MSCRSARLVFIALLIHLLTLATSAYADDQEITRGHKLKALAEAALARTRVRVIYDGRYQKLAYPGGDVANNRGVCSDVVIRAYRALDIDLQARVHEDMRRNFNEYPSRWGLSGPDRNIDHRRVPNLERFFERQGAALSTSRDAEYLPGDIVSWRLPSGAPHIGIVQAERSVDGRRPLVVHNIGAGPKREDRLFAYAISGHFRYVDPVN